MALPRHFRQITDYFIEEAEHHLATLAIGFQDLPHTLSSPDQINRLWQASHSIKAGAFMLSLQSILKTARCLEEATALMRIYPIRPDAELMCLLNQVLQQLQAQVVMVKGSSSSHELDGNYATLSTLALHLNHLIAQVANQPTLLHIQAATGSEEVELWGQCSFRAGDRLVRQFPGQVMRHLAEPSSFQTWLEPQPVYRLDLSIQRLSSVEALQTSVLAIGSAILQIQVTELQDVQTPFERRNHLEPDKIDPNLKPCGSCRYYYGRRDGGIFLVCAIHPQGPERTFCHDWQAEIPKPPHLLRSIRH